ncbi:unnamed protein product [Rotaria sp. Silwood1]|nr:unnamed protein product [Rotaria sp. Silwood1]
MGINKRFDRIVNDSIFTRNLTLITPFNDLNQLTGPILDRFCLQIIPQIHHKIEWIHIESSWIEPILQVTNYPNLHGLGLYNLTSKRATDLFTEKNDFANNHNHKTYNEVSTKPFYLNCYHSYRPLPDLSINSDQQIDINPSIYINKYINKQSSFMLINNDSTLLYGNSIIKSNKATILNIFDQQLLDGYATNTYVNKHGI